MRLARVFPRKTNGTPDDALAFVGPPPKKVEVDRVHVSVSFTYDMEEAEKLADQWSKIAPVEMGGPAFGKPSGIFVPGMYLKGGYTITSRGCPNKCWFCSVWKREPAMRELPIRDEWVIQDDNLLACSDAHICDVFEMLDRQKNPVQLMGLEAAILEPWHVDLMWRVRPKQLFFAYDTPDDLEPLIHAGRMLRYADFTRSHLRCYVLIGFKKDTFVKAQTRLIEAWRAGFLPCAMLWKNEKGETSGDWRKFQRSWMRPAAIRSQMKGTTILYF